MSIDFENAINILREYNEWRRGGCVSTTHIQPSILGHAIDIITSEFQNYTFPTNEEIEQELLNRFGFTEDDDIDPMGQIKIFNFMDWLEKERGIND